ncbi:hypothetical protein OC835_001596 [Tilletia horrida]|nr:hypothetical protein OC835_001596 [Tilletia horrida]
MSHSFSPPPSYHYALGPDHHAPAALFEPPQRKKVSINLLTVILKFALSIGLLAALIVGYILGFKIIHIGPVAVGLYGVVLIADFLVQLTCALANRASVNNIVEKRRALVTEQHNVFTDKYQAEAPRTLLYPDASISIAVVGYREDDDAWRLCLRSIQKQSMRPRQVIAVVDGNEAPDLKMANSFADEYAGSNTAMVHLPILLSSVHKEVYHASLQRQGFQPPGFFRKVGRWLNGSYAPQQEIAFAEAREAVIQQVEAWEREFNISAYDSICFSQPHGHKRTAMFTAFCVAMYATRTRDAIFTTDSDTLLQEDALDEMFAVLDSDAHIGGVTADVKIFNRAESWLARFCSIRYWFAFNIERGCQSFWRCVGCISGPMGLYRAYDMDAILGKWNLQTFAGKETTFGDDRHLTNQLLAHGLKTRYTHRTWCESESPTSFVRWIKQQTRWSKSFFREAFWFPKSFLYQQWWMTVETTKQALYPFILISTITLFMYKSESVWRPLAWLTTMIGVAFIKSLVGAFIAADLWMIAFTGYCVIYFLGLLPSKIFALFTMAQTTWGTSARSAAELRKGESFAERTFHVGFLLLWYTFLSTGMAVFTYRCLIQHPIALCIAPAGLIPGVLLYAELVHKRIKLAFEDSSKSAQTAAGGGVQISHPMPAVMGSSVASDMGHNVLRKPHRPQRPGGPSQSHSGFDSVDLAGSDTMGASSAGGMMGGGGGGGGYPYTPSMTEYEFNTGDSQHGGGGGGHFPRSASGMSTLNNSAMDLREDSSRKLVYGGISDELATPEQTPTRPTHAMQAAPSQPQPQLQLQPFHHQHLHQHQLQISKGGGHQNPFESEAYRQQVTGLLTPTSPMTDDHVSQLDLSMFPSPGDGSEKHAQAFELQQYQQQLQMQQQDQQRRQQQQQQQQQVSSAQQQQQRQQQQNRKSLHQAHREVYRAEHGFAAPAPFDASIAQLPPAPAMARVI